MVPEILSVKHLDLFAESFFFPYLAACNSILWAVLTKSQLQNWLWLLWNTEMSQMGDLTIVPRAVVDLNFLHLISTTVLGGPQIHRDAGHNSDWST